MKTSLIGKATAALAAVIFDTPAKASACSTTKESAAGNGVSKQPRGKPRGISETEVFGPGSTRVSRVGLGVSPEPSEPLSAGRRAQHARRVRSPDPHK